MARLILVLGGARSGKSAFAERLAGELAGNSVLYVATAEAGDDEMRQRIEAHQRQRPQSWRTLEAQRDVGAAIENAVGDAGAVLVDCLTLLVANPLMADEEAPHSDPETAVLAEVDSLIASAKRLGGTVVVVSNEVGMGLVPLYPMGRAYRDLLGQANQVVARRADEVYLLVAGIPVKIKG